jgi:hypothetical protein
MKLTIPKPTEIEAVSVRVFAPVRYDEEDIPNDFPCRNGDMWEVTIDLETGVIHGWPGRAARIHMKVVDTGTYYLLDVAGNQIAEREGECVPSFFPGDHYGDYIIFDIGADGKIADWSCDADDLCKAFFPDED